MEKARESYNKRDYNEGLSHLEVILKDRNFIATLANKAIFLGMLEKHKVIEWYNMALTIEPKNTNFLGNKGYAPFRLGKYEAIECFDKVLDIQPISIYALTNKGNSLGGLGKYEQTIEWFDKALAIDPHYAEA